MDTNATPELGLNPAVDRLIRATPDMDVIEYLRRFLLARSQLDLNGAMASRDPEEQRELSARATLQAMCARALDALEAGEDAATVGWELYEASRDGENLATWVAEELTDRGIEITA